MIWFWWIITQHYSGTVFFNWYFQTKVTHVAYLVVPLSVYVRMVMKEICAGVSVRASKRCLSLRTLVEFTDFCECEGIIHAFVVSELDHCNTILHWLPKSQLDKLQCVSNNATRLLLLTNCTRRTFIGYETWRTLRRCKNVAPTIKTIFCSAMITISTDALFLDHVIHYIMTKYKSNGIL